MEIFSWGANSHGQLGQGTLSEQCGSPQPLKQCWNVPIKEIFCGGAHSLFLDEDGEVYGCGWNEHKQLGCECKKVDGFNLHTATKIWDLSGIRFETLCAGWDSSAGITDKNVLYLWGSNAYGQLGLPKEHFPKYVKPIQLELRVKSVSMGMRHTAIIDIYGYVWMAGSGRHGQLGQGEDILNTDSFKKLNHLEDIEKVKCGQNHTLAWSKVMNKIYAWGDNTYRQLGFNLKVPKSFVPQECAILKDFIEQIVDIDCGWTHNAALLNDGRAIYWGRNNYGQLGNSVSDTNFNIVSIIGKAIKELSLGSEHSVCVLEDDSLWSWGWNEHGNTGIGDDQNVTEPKIINFNLENGRKKRLFIGNASNFVIKL